MVTGQKPEIIVITGEIRQGKTTFVKNLIEELKKQNIKIAGFLAIGIDVNGVREGFELMNILTGEKIPVCTTRFSGNSFQMGRYYFDPLAFRQGNNWLISAMTESPDVIVIDEIGPLELQNQGWAPAINVLLKEGNALQIWIIRKGLVEEVLDGWKIKNLTIFNISSDSPDSVKRILMTKLAERKQGKVDDSKIL